MNHSIEVVLIERLWVEYIVQLSKLFSKVVGLSWVKLRQSLVSRLASRFGRGLRQEVPNIESIDEACWQVPD